MKPAENVIRMFVVIILLVFSVVVSGERCFWWVIGSTGGDMSTSGQPVIGKVSGDDGRDGSYGFWHEDLIPYLCFSVSPDNWDIDSTEILETRTMTLSEGITLNICGNTDVCFGLRIARVEPSDWVPSHRTSLDRFVLRAQFSEAPAAPLIYSPYYDYIGDVVTWADGTKFGGFGNDVSHYGMPSHLFFQFIAPSVSTNYEIPTTITTQLYARATLP